MKIYVVALAAGLLVGLIYALLQVRSPAPPVVALVGLLGMLIGEQSVPMVKRMLAREPVTASWLRTHCVARITGIPARPTDAGTPTGHADAPTTGEPHA
jgi:XapX domain-containing protein